MEVRLYEDSSAPVDARVEDLLQRMTLEEKVAQLGSVGPEVLLNDQGEICFDKAQAAIPHGIGQITRMAGASDLAPDKAAKAANAIQQFLE